MSCFIIIPEIFPCIAHVVTLTFKMIMVSNSGNWKVYFWAGLDLITCRDCCIVECMNLITCLMLLLVKGLFKGDNWHIYQPDKKPATLVFLGTDAVRFSNFGNISFPGHGCSEVFNFTFWWP